MIRARIWLAAPVKSGTAGHLFLFAWSLAIVMVAPPSRALFAALLAILAATCFYPGAIRRAFRPRWILLLALMALPSLFTDVQSITENRSLAGLNFAAALRTVTRAFVILVAVDGLTSSVEVGQIAALFERTGFKGLGFALGVALNMLPILRETTTVTWQSLRMRGGLHRQPVRGLRYFLITVVSSSLRRASDIALAAEARGYDPDKGRPPALHSSAADRPLMLAGALVFLLLLLLP